MITPLRVIFCVFSVSDKDIKHFLLKLLKGFKSVSGFKNFHG